MYMASLLVCGLRLLYWLAMVWSSCSGFQELVNIRNPGRTHFRDFEDSILMLPTGENEFTFVKRQVPTTAELSALMADLTPEKLKDLIQSGDIRYLAMMQRPQTTFTPRIGRKKRSLAYEDSDEDDEKMLSGESVEEAEEITLRQLLQPALRFGRKGDNVKTIHLQSSFIPRLGRKRSDLNSADTRSKATGISGRSQQHVINLSAGSAFTPRLGRSGLVRNLIRSERSLGSNNKNE